MRYAAHEELVAPARNGRQGLLWTVAGTATITVFTYILTLMLVESLRSYHAGRGDSGFAEQLFTGTTPLTLLTVLFSFVAWLVAIWITLHWVHNRRFTPLLGPNVLFHFRRVLLALVVLNLALVVLPPWDLLADTVPGLDASRWVALLPISLLAVLVQVSAEELLFRGYLQQQLAARVRSPLVWMGVPSLLFAVAHYDAAMGSNAWLIVIWAAMFACLMADITARTGSLGAAIAIHFVNNTLGILLISPPDYLSGLALYTSTFAMTDEAVVRSLLPIDFALMIVSWLAARLALRC